jgi:hypothetical protein
MASSGDQLLLGRICLVSDVGMNNRDPGGSVMFERNLFLGGYWEPAVWLGLLRHSRLRSRSGRRSLSGLDPECLEDAAVVGGLSAIGAALYGIGIPKK